MSMRIGALLIALLVPWMLPASIPEDLAEQVINQGITVDLREPTYSNGVLETQQGGIITAPNLRIQAKKISYVRKTVDGVPMGTIDAEGDLLVEIGDYVFIGRRLEYNFETETGIIYDGRTAVEPWFIGGKTIHISSEGNYLIHDAFVTTSENYYYTWEIASDESSLTDGYLLDARNVQFRFYRVPLMWLPSLKVDLNVIFDHPIRYNVRWGGRQGPRIGMMYEVFSWDRWKGFCRLDYRVKRGIGGGFETSYVSEDHKQEFDSMNYFAPDISLSSPHRHHRYRFQGHYRNLFASDSTSLEITYDKISDKDMPSDYDEKGITIETMRRTQLHVRRQENSWIANFFVRPRINDFQTLKQELPTLDLHWRPIELGYTGIITDNQIRFSYLDFTYDNSVKDVHDYNAPRVEFSNRFYKTLSSGTVTATPEAGLVAIYYGNSPEKEDKWATLGVFGCEVTSSLYRFYDCWKHVMQPYLDYHYYTFPTTNPEDHYIFDIEDDWYRLNLLRAGMRHNLYYKGAYPCYSPFLEADFWVNSFVDTPTIPKTIPKVYTKITAFTTTSLRHSVETAWDFEENQLDHLNVRTEWTLTEDIAVATEYRHRSPFDWRKVEHNRFVLDSFRTIEELRESELSDRRDTVLAHMFYRFHPDWALEVRARHGWNRHKEPTYMEYEFNLMGTIRSTWHSKLSYQHKEDDKRFVVYLTVGLQRPRCLE